MAAGVPKWLEFGRLLFRSATAAPGTSVTATWSGIATPTSTDWIGLYAAGAPASSFVDWVYVSCAKSAGAALASGSGRKGVVEGLSVGLGERRLVVDNGNTR